MKQKKTKIIEAQEQVPNIFWYQNFKKIFILINEFDLNLTTSKIEIFFKKTTFYIKNIRGQAFKFEIDFFSDIHKDFILYDNERLLKLVIYKKDYQIWPRLTRQKEFFSWIKVYPYNFIQDSDDDSIVEDDEENEDLFGFSSITNTTGNLTSLHSSGNLINLNTPSLEKLSSNNLISVSDNNQNLSRASNVINKDLNGKMLMLINESITPSKSTANLFIVKNNVSQSNKSLICLSNQQQKDSRAKSDLNEKDLKNYQELVYKLYQEDIS